jgi:hypothetical protein
MAPPQQQEASFREGRIALAIQAYETGQLQSVKAATDAYNVPRSTIRDRIKGIQPKRGSIAKNRLLTSTEEETLV